MNLETILTQILDATGAFNPKIAVVLYAICAIGEFGPAIPYLLETIWLMAGYQLATWISLHGARGLSPSDLFLFWLIAQIGRQTGSTALYSVSRVGSTHLMKLYKKYLEGRLAKRQIIPAGVKRRLLDISPFSVALGRLFGLRIPLALTLGARRKLKVLSLGVLLSSLVFDAIYLFIGATVGATTSVEPVNMFFYSLLGLTVLYAVTLAIRLIKRLHSSVAKVE